MKRILLLPVTLAAAMLSAGNLLYNSSFELGMERYGSVRCKEITSAEIKYPGPDAEIDTATAAQGNNSLKLELKKQEELRKKEKLEKKKLAAEDENENNDKD